MRYGPISETDFAGEPEQQHTKMWLLTFTDLVSLLLTFFVLLFSMTGVKTKEWEDVVDSLSESLSPKVEESAQKPTDKLNIGLLFKRRAINLEYLTSLIEETLSADPVLRDALIIKLEDRLVIALPGDLLFNSGQALINDRAEAAMLTLGAMFQNVDNAIVVTGHTDPVPLSGGGFSSNWELSIARASSVANAIRRGGYDEQIVALGYADSQYNGLPNLDEQKRHQLARRVDIIVMPTADRL